MRKNVERKHTKPFLLFGRLDATAAYEVPERGEKRHLRCLAHVQDSNVASMSRKRLVADFFGVLENAHVVHDPLASDLPRIDSQPADHGKGYHE